MTGGPQKLLLQRCIILGIVLFQTVSATAQDDYNNTHKVYKKIKTYANKHKFTRFIYENVFTDPPVPVDPSTSNNKSKSNKQKKSDPNAKYVGRVIRSIKIEVYDPFGHSVNDTLVRVVNRTQRLGNRIHITTRNRIIRNLLLFKKNQKVDILKITESERILRTAQYVNDARIYIIGDNIQTDSVDVKVIVQDRWSLDAAAQAYSATEGLISLTDQNLLGQGQQFGQSYDHDFSTGETIFNNQYYINNISRTYISSTLFYTTTTNKSQTGLSISRPFFSPLAKWAGGISGTKTWDHHIYLDKDSVLQKIPLEYFNTDYWVGKSFNPRKSNTIDNRSRNITVAVRYANTQYQKRPSFDIDTNRLNLNYSLYLGSLGYTVRKYYKDKYIYRFGANEDIPEGWLIQGTSGILDKEQYKFRYYAGFDISRGKHFDRLGYLSGSFSYGNYFNQYVKNDAAINIGFLYFSNLLMAKRWYFRQFVYYKFIYGINKTPVERISFSPTEMYGFNNGKLNGTRKMVMNFETVMYTPYNVIGFRFAPVVLIGLGMIDTEQPTFFHTQIYQSYAVGLLIRNENLLTSSFQITVGGYPYTVPGNHTNFRFNPITSFTLRVYGFAIGKPSPVVYQ